MTATASREEVQNYFNNRVGDQDAGAPELIPASERKGGPPEGLCLFQMGEDDVTLEHSGEESKNPDHPYILFFAEVLAPEEFEGTRIKGMFYFPVMPEADDAKAMKKFDAQTARNIGQVDAILGEGTVASIEAVDLEESLDELISLLDGASFVGKVGIEKAKGEYAAKNRITRFAQAETWTEESN